MPTMRASRSWRALVLSNLVALFVLATLGCPTLLAIPSVRNVVGDYWAIVFLGWAVIGVYLWNRADVEPRSWLVIALESIVGAATWYVLMRLIAQMLRGDSEGEVSKLFDVVVALAISPGLTFVAICGWVQLQVARRIAGSTTT
jgi:hypothetical protein